MNIARQIFTVPHKTIGKNIYRKFRFSSVKYEASQTSQPQVQEETLDFEDIQILQRTDRRKAKIEPFMKNVFVSIFDRDLLAFPEIMNKEETEDVERRVQAMEAVFNDNTKTKEDRREVLKRTKMFAAPVSLRNNGLQCNYTESLRYLDVIGEDFELGQEICDHWVALEALRLGLTEEQYNGVIDDLTSGEHTVALCIKEKVSERLTQPDFRTTAEIDGQGVWRVSGEKVCSSAAGYKLVLAAHDGGRLKAFLAHPAAAGVTHSGTFVHFRNTPVTPLEQVSSSALSASLGACRLFAGALCRVQLRRATMAVVRYVKPRVFTGKPLSELVTIRALVGDALLDIYAAESAHYFTAGLMDGYHDPDVELELAMCRNLMSVHAPTTIQRLMSIPALEHGAECGRALQLVHSLLARGETLDSVNAFIAMAAIQHAGKVMSAEIKQVRNPLMHPFYIMKRTFLDRHQERDEPKLTLRLYEHLHPTLRTPADQLEYCSARLRYGAHTVMARHGRQLHHALTELSRLAEAGTEVLAMTAALARASRAYCIGLRNAEVEMKLAACFTERARNRVQTLIKEIDDGEFLNHDRFRIEFGRKVLDTDSFLVEKPTARVFW